MQTTWSCNRKWLKIQFTKILPTLTPLFLMPFRWISKISKLNFCYSNWKKSSLMIKSQKVKSKKMLFNKLLKRVKKKIRRIWTPNLNRSINSKQFNFQIYLKKHKKGNQNQKQSLWMKVLKSYSLRTVV